MKYIKLFEDRNFEDPFGEEDWDDGKVKDNETFLIMDEILDTSVDHGVYVGDNTYIKVEEDDLMVFIDLLSKNDLKWVDGTPVNEAPNYFKISKNGYYYFVINESYHRQYLRIFVDVDLYFDDIINFRK